MKVSIIITVLNSHEVVRRQLMHFSRIGIPADTEIIIVDDGSDPPLDCSWANLPLTVHRTNDTRQWTWALARNAGARIARGEYLIMVDLDHIITRELIDAVRGMNGEDHMLLWREFAVLDERGVFVQDMLTLMNYGWPVSRWKDRGFRLPPHRNQFAIHKDLFWKLNGYAEDRVGLPYPQREDGDFSQRWDELQAKEGINVSKCRPTLYMFPNGKYCGDVDYNPFNLFHDLSRKTERNPFHRKAKGLSTDYADCAEKACSLGVKKKH